LCLFWTNKKESNKGQAQHIQRKSRLTSLLLESQFSFPISHLFILQDQNYKILKTARLLMKPHHWLLGQSNIWNRQKVLYKELKSVKSHLKILLWWDLERFYLTVTYNRKMSLLEWCASNPKTKSLSPAILVSIWRQELPQCPNRLER
jgi:hypothetical protein